MTALTAVSAAAADKPLPIVFIHRSRISMASKFSTAIQLTELLNSYPDSLESANPRQLLLGDYSGPLEGTPRGQAAASATTPRGDCRARSA